ncbi:MAG: phosphoribosylformylglycinamidine cyclo-ligase [Verrucomicrobiales bacterium]|jgi:phosphoribosylformylglycinamidine cyclo-ligase|nr:phosphoribosylformylglycinamidine cyclo-ligase [Verrucomicrobiales bacterium]
MKKSTKSKKAYAAAGVDIDLGNKVKSGIGARIASTHRKEVLSKIGGFGGLFRADFKGYKEPVLVSSVDGVGTKLKIATMLNRHDTIGQDLVNHCVNDIAVVGAEPLFFLDYVGTGKLEPKTFNQILSGLAVACKEAGCALIGGETAQMPGIYQGGDYDLVGCIVGVVDRKKAIDGSKIKKGDVIIGFPSSGLHTNGYSLAREILFNKLGLPVQTPLPGSKQSLGEALLMPHINYQPLLKKLSKKVTFKGLSHITGGGFVDNIPRILPKNVDAVIHVGTWPTLPVFELLEQKGGVAREELYQVFNMGIGMVAIVSSKDAPKVLEHSKSYIIGQIEKGSCKVQLKF